MFYKVLFVWSLVVLVSSSSFSFNRYFERAAVQKLGLTKGQISFGIKHQIKAVESYLITQLPANAPTRRALIEKNAQAKPQLWLLLAEEAIKHNAFDIAINYWIKAEKKGVEQASLLLTEHYLAQEDYERANTHLSQLTSDTYWQNENVLKKKAEILFALGRTEVLERFLQAHAQYADIIDFSKIYNHYRFGASRVNHLQGAKSELPTGGNKQCVADISLVATNLKDLERWHIISQQFSTHPLSQFLCINEIKYKPINTFDCQYAESNAIMCNELSWREQESYISSRFIGVMLPKGKANVHYGILYLDRADTVDVFAHEVAHLFGFVDEYPLSSTHRICQSAGVKGHNLVVVPKDKANSFDVLNSNDVASTLGHSFPWQANEIMSDNATDLKQQFLAGYYPSETCNNSEEYQAYKPLYEFTSLRSNNAPFPSLYVELLKDNPESYLMPSFHYNIAFALYQSGQVTNAKAYLAKAATYFQNKALQKKAARGGF